MELTLEELTILKRALEVRSYHLSLERQKTLTIIGRDYLDDEKKANNLLLGKIEAEIEKGFGI